LTLEEVEEALASAWTELTPKLLKSLCSCTYM